MDKKKKLGLICVAISVIVAIFIAGSRISTKNEASKIITSTTVATTVQNSVVDNEATTQIQSSENNKSNSTSVLTPEEKSSLKEKYKEADKSSQNHIDGIEHSYQNDEENQELAISMQQAIDMLNNFYGSTYSVHYIGSDQQYQHFSIIDKKGNEYAIVRVDLKNGTAIETVIKTQEKNEYNLLV